MHLIEVFIYSDCNFLTANLLFLTLQKHNNL